MIKNVIIGNSSGIGNNLYNMTNCTFVGHNAGGSSTFKN